jgi:hypothetical protein
MPEVTRRLINLVFPAILLVFVALYVLSLGAGNAPELAMFRAGGASVLLAVLARLGIRIIENGALKADRPDDVATVQPTPLDGSADSADQDGPAGAFAEAQGERE